jgi:CMP-N-acetylneuraminic acid synthetase
MNLERIVALIPMRHHSQRVPGKNYRLLNGKPLFHHIVETLLKCPEIGKIMIDTDSSDVREGVSKYFPSVDVLDRPEHLRADDISMNEVLLYDTSVYPADLYLQTHSTNPMLRSESVSKGIGILRQYYPGNDSLFSVTRIQSRLYDELARPINHNPNILIQTQDLPPVYEENSCLYLFTRDNLEKRRTRIGDRPYLLELDPFEAWDIDEEIDFRIADLMMQARLTTG